jgi:hypothetical protein
MKVAVECKSPLMQKSLELFLNNHLCSSKHCDVVIRDVKSSDERSFYVSSDKESDLIKPFSKSQLIMALENRYKSIKKESSNENASLDFEILQKRIKSLTDEYQSNILKTVKAFYEK